LSTFVWEDPDDGIKYELMYNVPQTGQEREGVLWRIQGFTLWHELPPFAEVPQEAMEHWHGKVVKAEPTTYMTIVQTANELGISYDALRAWLRERYKRPEYEGETEWGLPPNVVAAARERFQG
jgi:hypothetical protein